MRIDELISKLPSDTQNRVKDAKERFNKHLRQAMRDEAGLALRDRSGTDSESVTVPIYANVALPKSAATLQFPDEHWLGFLLAPWRPVLEQLRDSTTSITEDVFKALGKDVRAANIIAEARGPIAEAREFSEFALHAVNRLNLVNKLYEIDDHVLGRYIWPTDGSKPGEIYLYWGAIGLIARQLSLRTEDLAVVVLAHELAHAYTHVGADIEGHRWPTQLFTETDSNLKEALAQHFTLQICQRINPVCPDAEKAFQALLPHQPKVYLGHEQWTEFRAEEIRLALICTRRAPERGTMRSFTKFLVQARRDLRSGESAIGQPGLFYAKRE